MAMQHSERELGKLGDHDLAKIQAGLREAFIKRHPDLKDIPFPSIVTPVEKPAVKTPEAPVEIKRFSHEAREALDKQGFTVLELTGRSISALRDSGCKFWSDWHKNYPGFEALSSIRSEVAVNRKELFLPKSQNKTFDEQVKMVDEFSNKLGSKIPGVEAIMGQAADYVELAFVHLDKNQGKDYLFGETDNYNYTRTKTPVDSNVVDVGDFSAGDGLDVSHWSCASRRPVLLRVAPLVVPIGK